jgi:hypothetical protein
LDGRAIVVLGDGSVIAGSVPGELGCPPEEPQALAARATATTARPTRCVVNLSLPDIDRLKTTAAPVSRDRHVSWLVSW